MYSLCKYMTILQNNFFHALLCQSLTFPENFAYTVSVFTLCKLCCVQLRWISCWMTAYVYCFTLAWLHFISLQYSSCRICHAWSIAYCNFGFSASTENILVTIIQMVDVFIEWKISWRHIVPLWNKFLVLEFLKNESFQDISVLKCLISLIGCIWLF